jgi:predicted amidohydrolase YtcJ
MLSLLAAVAFAALPPADVIYVDGPILAMGEGQPDPEALAVLNGRIAAVGKTADVMRLRGPGTRIVVLGKRALLPGFVDPHSHFLAALVTQDWANVSLPPVGTVRSIKVYGPDERITTLQALRAITADAAYQYREEKERGTLEVGKVADLVLLSANPLKVDPAALRDVKVVETVKSGKTVYVRAAR